MPTDDIRQDIWDLLEDFQGEEPLKELFWSKLNYTRVNESLSRRGWTDKTTALLENAPLLFAGGGQNDEFHIIYARMASGELRLTEERQIVSKLLTDHPYSLFVFSNSQQDHWHFVNVKYDKDQRSRRVFRRITVGRNERLRTATERISLLDLEQINPDLFGLDPFDIQTAHDNAFDVEAVTAQFFTQYNQVFQRVEELIVGIPDEEQKRLFTQRLFNRMLFISFIEKKGWLKYEEESDYLNALWVAYQDDTEAKSSFYSSRLKLLFFSGLNNPQEVNLTDINRGGLLQQLIGDVPYLNGGLFEEEDDDRNPDIIVPDKCFQTMLGDLFNRFNFTVTESTPLDQEVAVDPEMLGKVFEELIIQRNQTGSYYTPKVVVSFMCREALKGFLGGYEKLVDEHDPSEISLGEARELLLQLTQIKIVDPACGSGAYLLGMMHELHALMHVLDTRAEEESARDDYQRKLSIIQNNIYGVDIDPFAVNIARLRLWLSLAVEYEGEQPEPLPNLDLKIEEGDSLSAPDPSMGGGMTIDVFRQQQIANFYELKSRYQHTYKHGEKQTLLDGIIKLRQEITDWLHPSGSITGFDWQVEFIEVFSREHATGFDIVVANPPYGVKVSAALRDSYFPEGRQSKDTYGIFIARALQLLCPGGQLSFIVSDTWRTIKTHRPLRKRLLRRASVKHVIDLPPWIFKATVNTGILGLTKNNPNDGHILIAADLSSIGKGEWNLLAKNLTAIASSGPDLQTTSFARYSYPQNLINDYSNASFFIGLPELYNVLSNAHYTRLRLEADVKVGLQTSDNEYYLRKKRGARGSYGIIDEKQILTNEDILGLSNQEKLHGVDPNDFVGRRFVPFDKGGKSQTEEGWLPNYNVPTQYYIDWSEDSVTRLRTATIADIKRRKGQEDRITSSDEETIGAYIRNPQYYFRSGVSFSPTGIYSPTFRCGSGTIFGNKGSTIFSESFKRDTLLWILCSLTARYLLKVFCSHTVETGEEVIGQLNVPPIPTDVDERLCAQVGSIIEKQQQNPDYSYHQFEQQEIDRLVFQLYDLTDEDIREIELWYCRRYHKLAEAQGILVDVEGRYETHLARCDNILDQPPGYWRSHPILELVGQGEGPKLEYKETLAVDAETGDKHQGVLHSALKTIAAFLNTDGGSLLIGVSDTGEIKGLEKDYEKCKKKNADSLELKLRDLIKDRFQPHPLGNISVEFAEFDGKAVCKVQVTQSDEIIHLDKGDVFVRDGNKTLKLEGPELTRWVQKRTGS